MTFDRCERIGASLVQHGPFSNRVYLMKLDQRDLPGIIDKIEALAAEHGYTKLFAKVPAPAAEVFIGCDYRPEAIIPGFYKGRRDALFVCKYLDRKRESDDDPQALEAVLELAAEKAAQSPDDDRPCPGAQIFQCGPDDADRMSRLYRDVFPTYPFPIHDAGYIRETMETHIDYFGAVIDGELAALSSAEMDKSAANVEMTDFATLPKFRGRGLGRCLLAEMEKAMLERRMLVAYTIARAVSPGMNIVFARRGYHYSGTLIKNTQISGNIESMNVWYKSL